METNVLDKVTSDNDNGKPILCKTTYTAKSLAEKLKMDPIGGGPLIKFLVSVGVAVALPKDPDAKGKQAQQYAFRNDVAERVAKIFGALVE